ncbi:MAG TPA: helix-turn-helix transcriptional regulator [Pyrinomonadaceae bacterium]
MNERSKLINNLLNERDYRAAYIRAKLDVLIPSQLRALRLRQEKTQPKLAEMADMKQSRVSAMETPGKVNFNLDTLVRMAATFKVALVVEFVAFSEMLRWENDYTQDTFNVVQLPDDVSFLRPAARPVYKRARRNRNARRFISRTGSVAGIGVSTYVVSVQQQGSQMKLQFEPSEQPAQSRLADVITLANRSGSIVNNLPFLRAVVGAGRKYGTRQINR